jgi:hypothetical protein
MSNAEFVSVEVVDTAALREGDEVLIRFEGDDAKYKLTVVTPGDGGIAPTAIFARGVGENDANVQWTEAKDQPYHIMTSLPDVVDQGGGKDWGKRDTTNIPPRALVLGHLLVLMSEVEGKPSRVASDTTIRELAMHAHTADTSSQAS